MSLKIFKNNRGKEPFVDWLKALDGPHKAKVSAYVLRHLSMPRARSKSIKALGKGLFELKIDAGPGLRVYFMHNRENEIILLCGGSKRTQWQDMNAARKWQEVVNASFENI